MPEGRRELAMPYLYIFQLSIGVMAGDGVDPKAIQHDITDLLQAFNYVDIEFDAKVVTSYVLPADLDEGIVLKVLDDESIRTARVQSAE